jgi:hypothetical protein
MSKTPNAFQISYTVTPQEFSSIYFSLFFIHPGSTWEKMKIGLGLPLALGAGIITWVVIKLFSYFPYPFLSSKEMTISLFIFYFLILVISSFRKHNKKYQEFAGKTLSISVNLEEKTIVFSDEKKENLNTLHPKDIVKITVGKIFICIVHRTGLIYFLPKRCFTDAQIQAVAQTFSS